MLGSGATASKAKGIYCSLQAMYVVNGYEGHLVQMEICKCLVFLILLVEAIIQCIAGWNDGAL